MRTIIQLRQRTVTMKVATRPEHRSLVRVYCMVSIMIIMICVLSLVGLPGSSCTGFPNTYTFRMIGFHFLQTRKPGWEAFSCSACRVASASARGQCGLRPLLTWPQSLAFQVTEFCWSLQQKWLSSCGSTRQDKACHGCQRCDAEVWKLARTQ